MKRINTFALMVVVVFLSVFAFSGCASKEVAMPTSGFLDDYSNFEVIEGHKGFYVKQYSGRDISQYEKIMIAPPKIYFDTDSKKIEDEMLNEITQSLQKGLSETLEQKYDIVDSPGPGVLLIKTAITDVTANKVYYNLHWSTTLAGWGIGGAVIESEFIDSQTNQKVVSVVSPKKGKRTKYFKGLSKWGHTNGVVEGWGEFLVDCLEKL